MKTRFPHAYVLNVMADDRPGIVAAVSRAVLQQEGNIDACSQTVLHGYFTLIMIVSFRQATDPQRLREAVAGSSVGQAGFGVHIRPFQPVEPVVLDGENFVITAFGPDREGVIAQFSAFLADKGINIIDLFGDRKGDQFVLIGQVCVPGRWDTQLIQADLEQMAADSGYTVRLQHENVFVATNELRLTRGQTRRPV